MMVDLLKKISSPAITLVIGSLVAQAILFATSPIITRLFNPEEFAVLNVYTSIVSLFAAFAVLRLDIALFTVHVDRLAKIVCIAAIVSALISTVIGIIFFTINVALSIRYSGINLFFLSVCVTFGLFGSSVYATVSGAAIMKGDYRATASTRVFQALAGGAVQVLAGYLGASSPGLIIGYLVSQSMGISQLWKRVAHGAPNLERADWWSETISHCRNDFRGFVLYSAPASILNRLSGSLGVILFAAIYDLRSSGLFALALRSTSAPLLAVGRGLAQTFQKEYATTTTRSPREVICSTIIMLAVLGVVPCGLLLFEGPWLFGYVFGKNWTQAGLFAAILSPSLLLQFIAFPIAQSFSLGKHFRKQLIWDSCRSFTIIVLFATLHFRGVTVEDGVMAISFVLSLIYLSQILMAVFSSSKFKNDSATGSFEEGSVG